MLTIGNHFLIEKICGKWEEYKRCGMKLDKTDRTKLFKDIKNTTKYFLSAPKIVFYHQKRHNFELTETAYYHQQPGEYHVT